MNIRNWLCIALLLFSFAGEATAQDAGSDSVLASLQHELTRSFTNLKKQPTPVYFLAYQLTDNHAINAGASFGALLSSSDMRTRTLDVDLRVGDYALDNTHAADAAMDTYSPRQYCRCAAACAVGGNRP